MTPFRRNQVGLSGSQLVRAVIAGLLVFLAGAVVYRLIGVNVVGAILFAVACGVIRLVLFRSPP